MSVFLVIFGGDRPEAPVRWRGLDARGEVAVAGEGDVADLSGIAANDAALVLPGYLVSAIETPLPARSERQALAAAPFAVEDELAADPDDQHFAIVPARKEGADGRRTVLAMDRALLSDWHDALAGLRCPLRAVLPDYLCLPSDRERVLAVATDDRLVLRHGDWGVAIDGDMADAVAPAVLSGRETEAGPHLLAGEGFGIDGLAAADRDGGDPFVVLADGARNAGPGVLQGAFAVRRGSGDSSFTLGALKWPAVMAAAATLTVSAVSLVQGLMLQAQAETVREETQALFMQAFPETGRLVNVRAQLREVSQTGDGARPDFLVLSGYVAQGLEQVEAVSIQSLRFDSEANELNASIVFDSYDALARFRAAVETAGGRVVEGGSRQVGDRRAGDVKVTLP